MSTSLNKWVIAAAAIALLGVLGFSLMGTSTGSGETTMKTENTTGAKPALDTSVPATVATATFSLG